MKTVIFACLIGLLSFSGYAQSNAKNEKIKKLMELTGSGELGVQVIKNMVPAFQKAYPNVPQSFWDEFVKEVKPSELIDLIIPIYSKYYTEQDVDQMITFYNSPVGKKTISTLPMIMQESMNAGQTWGMQLGQKVAQQLKEKGYSKD